MRCCPAKASTSGTLLLSHDKLLVDGRHGCLAVPQLASMVWHHCQLCREACPLRERPAHLPTNPKQSVQSLIGNLCCVFCAGICQFSSTACSVCCTTQTRRKNQSCTRPASLMMSALRASHGCCTSTWRCMICSGRSHVTTAILAPVMPAHLLLCCCAMHRTIMHCMLKLQPETLCLSSAKQCGVVTTSLVQLRMQKIVHLPIAAMQKWLSKHKSAICLMARK